MEGFGKDADGSWASYGNESVDMLMFLKEISEICMKAKPGEKEKHLR